jgi:predicted pyridoxine 5'-phosphate oxidase superfamily flavin-nucleotide-binding protein
MPMSTPATTTLDKPYSNPSATAVQWEETRRVLETAELFWVSTVRADGRPHVTPVKVFAHAKGDPFGATTHRF